MDIPEPVMPDVPGAAEGLEGLRAAAEGCTRCPLHEPATQTVFGEGGPAARLVLLGEQPGDKEDLAGRPFVGPAGRVLDRGLEAAGIDRATTYVTNVVKHFKFERRGKRRIHQTPAIDEILACRVWLEGELASLQPQVVVALGATAAKSLYGKDYRVTKQRGEVTHAHGIAWTATVHPSSLLRIPSERREAATADFHDDLRAVAALLDG